MSSYLWDTTLGILDDSCRTTDDAIWHRRNFTLQRMGIEKIIVLEADSSFRSHLENYLRRCRYDVASAATIGRRARLSEQSGQFRRDFSWICACPTARASRLLKAVADPPATAAGGGHDRLWLGGIRRRLHEKTGPSTTSSSRFPTEQIEIHASARHEEFTTSCVKGQHLLEPRFRCRERAGSYSAAVQTMDALRSAHPQSRPHAGHRADPGRKRHWQGTRGPRASIAKAPRANAPFIKVNCAAVPENLIESEFFATKKARSPGR
jgi:hypothetical protein